MRKILLSAALAAICTMGMTAMASETTVNDGYNPGVNSYDASMASTAQTIIIYKGTEADSITGENIYYVDQSADNTGFGTAVTALMKANPTEGTYTVAVNGGNSTTFTISNGDAAVAGCVPTERIGSEKSVEAYGGEEYCSVGFKFTVTGVQFNSFEQIKSLVRAEEGTDWVATSAAESIEWDETPAIDGTTSVQCAIQVDWVPTTQADRFEIYLSTEAA